MNETESQEMKNNAMEGGWPKLNAEVIHRDLHDSPYYTKAEFIQNLFDDSFKI